MQMQACQRHVIQYVMRNGKDTYSKTPFKDTKHPRGKGGTFKKKLVTEEESVSYHHKFTPSKHSRGKDGTFNALEIGRQRYGSNKY